MTPIFIQNMGMYDYGLWEMLGSLVGYAGILSFGFQPALSRFSSSYKATGDNENLQLTYSCGLLFLGIIGLSMCLIFVSWALFFPETVAPEGGDSYKYTVLLLIIAFHLLFMFPGQVAESYLEGFQLFYLKNNITLFFVVGGFVVIYNYISPDNSILLLAAINALGQIIKYLIYMAILFHPKFGGLSPFKFKYSIIRIKELSKFGGKVFISGLSGRVETASDVLVIGTILGAKMVPFYAIPANLAMHVRSIALQLIHAFLPAFSELNANQETKKQKVLYIRSSKYIVALTLPLVIGVGILASPFISLWIGEEFVIYVDQIMCLLSIFIGLPLLNPLSRSYLTAENKHSILAKIMPIAAIFNLTISIVLVNYIGVVGAAIGSAIPVIFYESFLLFYSCKLLKVKVSTYANVVIKPTLISCLLMGVLLVALRTKINILGYFDLFCIVIAGGATYMLAYAAIGLSKRDREIVIDWIGNTQLKL